MSYGRMGTVSGDTTRKMGEILKVRGFTVDQWGHWHYGPYRFQMKRGVCRLGRKITGIGRSAYSSVGSWYYGKIVLAKFEELADRIVIKVNEAKAKAAAKRPATGGIAIEVKENEQKNGVEIKFASKPSPEVIEKVKANGFRWSKFQKLWYARRDEATLAFAYSLVDKPAPRLPSSPDMGTVLESELAESQPKVDDGIDYADRSNDTLALTGEPAFAPGQDEEEDGDDTPETDESGQFKLGGAINNPEYVAGQA